MRNRVSSRCWNGLRTLLESRDAAWTTLFFQIRLLGMTDFDPKRNNVPPADRFVRGRFRNFRHWPEEWSANGVRVGNRSGCTVLSRGSVAFLHQALQIQPALLSRLHAAGQVRAEVESVIELCHRGGGASIAACGFLTGGGSA